MSKIFYEKRGKRYFPVSVDHSSIKSYIEGTHLIVCKPGSTITIYNIDPAIAPMLAASTYMKDKMCMALVNESRFTPSKKLITQEQKDAWDTLAEAYGDEIFFLTRKTTTEIVDAGLKVLQEEASKLLTNPAVSKAYEQFMFVCKLTMENKNEN